MNIRSVDLSLNNYTSFGMKYNNENNKMNNEQKNTQSIKINTKNNNKQKLRFDNFKGREYDYDALEKKLLGWDNDD